MNELWLLFVVIIISGITYPLFRNRHQEPERRLESSDVLSNALSGTMALTIMTFIMPLLFPILFLLFGAPFIEIISMSSVQWSVVVFWMMSSLCLSWHIRLRNGKADPLNY